MAFQSSGASMFYWLMRLFSESQRGADTSVDSVPAPQRDEPAAAAAAAAVSLSLTAVFFAGKYGTPSARNRKSPLSGILVSFPMTFVDE